MSYGFIYMLANRAMPGLYKIGRTERSPSARCEELSNPTGVPMPFNILFYAEMTNHVRAEMDVHRAFADQRLANNREFFRADPVAVYRYVTFDATTVYTSPDMLYLLHQSQERPALEVV